MLYKTLLPVLILLPKNWYISVDGNKRVEHAAMETFLVLNGYEINASIDEQENIILQVVSSKLGRDELKNWLKAHLLEY